jgi:hypothetical protein
VEVDDGNNNEKSLNLNVDVKVIYDYVQSIKSSVQTWFDILNPRLSSFSPEEIEILERIYRIERRAENEIFLILVMVFYEKVTKAEDRIKLLNYIENMLFFSTLVEYRWSLGWEEDDFLRLSIKLASGEFNKNQVLNGLHSMWTETLSDKDLMESIIKNVNTNSRGFYDWGGMRYFLYEYEDYLRSGSKTRREKLSWDLIQEEDDYDHISVEHIYPQTARRLCWANKYSHYNQKQRAQLKNSLGNLVPLSKPKNSSLSNKCFDEKKSRKNDTVGFSYGCYSENEVALKEDWTAVEILDRGIKMAQFFQRRWNIKFENDEQLLKFLGIDFVIEKEGLSKSDYKDIIRTPTRKK